MVHESGRSVPSFQSFRGGKEAKDKGRKKENLIEDGSHKRDYYERDKHKHRRTMHEHRSRDVDTLFVVDRHGDLRAAEYGTSKYDRPKFNRVSQALIRHGAHKEHEEDQMETNDYVPVTQPSTFAAYRDPYRGISTQAGNNSESPVFSSSSPQEEIRALHARIEAQPDDEDAWLRLMDTQARLLGDVDYLTDSSMEAALAQMQMAVLDRAIHATEKNKHSIPLLLAQLRVASDGGIWPDDRVQQAWQELLVQPDKSVQDTLILWRHYCTFRKSKAAQVDGLVQVYQEAIAAATKLIEICTATQLQLIEQFRIDTTLEFCRMLQSAGYLEWGFATLQALLELHLCVWKEGIFLGLTNEDVLDLFCTWWDAEHPRVSDNSDFYKPFSIQDAHVPNVRVSAQLDELKENPGQTPKNAYHAWQLKELQSVTTPLLFHGAHHPDPECDPYSYVVATDLRPHLYIPRHSSFECLCMTLDAFFVFLGFPRGWIVNALYLGKSLPEILTPYAFLHHVPCPLPRLHGLSMPEAFWDGMRNDSLECTVLYAHLLPDMLIRRSKDSRGPWFHSLPCISRSDVRRAEVCLLQLHERMNASMHMTLPLAMLYAAVNEHRIARRVVRQQLQHTPQAVILWYAYVQLELALGNSVAVQKVGKEVLSAAHERDPLTMYFLAALWSVWIEVLWSEGAWDSCLQVTRCAVECQFGFGRFSMSEKTLTSPEKLHLLRALRGSVQRAPDLVNTYVLAIVEHILQSAPVGEELTTSVQVFRNALELNSELRIPLAQTCHRFVMAAQHGKKRAMLRPRDMRALTTKLIQESPNNTLILHMLMQQEQHARVDGHAQKMIEQLVIPDTSCDTEVRWMHAITATAPCANMSCMRALLNRAVHAAPRIRTLWYAALDWELRNAAKAQGRASMHARVKALIYQAFRHCPYEKGIVLLAMEPAFEQALTSEETFTIEQAGEEHQLRILADLPTHEWVSSGNDIMQQINSFVDEMSGGAV